MSQTSFSLPVRTIGIDLGDRESAFCILDQSGTVVDEGSVATEREALEELADPDRPVRVVIEASTHSSWVSKHLKDIGQEVIVANPRADQGDDDVQHARGYRCRKPRLRP